MKLLFICLSFLLLASCGQISSEEVSQELIKTNYSINYDADSDDLSLSGTFVLEKSQLTYVKLDGESNLVIDGKVSNHETNIFHQHTYNTKQSGYDERKSYQFTYSNSEGSRFYNSISLPSKTEFTSASVIEYGEDLNINWLVHNSNDGATGMYVILQYENGIQNYYLNLNVDRGVESIIYQDLERFSGQNILVKICRDKYNSVFDHPGAGGTISSTFCSKSKSVSIH